MNLSNSSHRRVLFSYTLLTSVVLLSTSCSSSKDENLTLVPVSGSISIGNTPLSSGQITFTPDKSKGNTSDKVPSAAVKDGTYTLMTASGKNRKEGAPPGWYKVSVHSAPPTSMAEGEKPGKSVEINPAYSNPTKTKLSVEVKEGAKAGAYDLKLEK